MNRHRESFVVELSAPAAGLLHTALATGYRLFGGITIVGAENIPAGGPAIFCANHISDSDPLAVYVAICRTDTAFMAKRELFTILVLGAIIRAFGSFAVRRAYPDRYGLNTGLGLLAKGRPIVMFPEGQTSEDGKLQELRPGAAWLALKSGAPIIPVGIARTNWMLPYSKLVPQRVRLPIRIHFGSAIDMTIENPKEGERAIDIVTSRLECAIRGLTNQSE